MSCFGKIAKNRFAIYKGKRGRVTSGNFHLQQRNYSNMSKLWVIKMVIHDNEDVKGISNVVPRSTGLEFECSSVTLVQDLEALRLAVSF